MAEVKMLNEKKLKAACLEKGKTYADLAKFLGVSLSTVYYRIANDTFNCVDAAKISDWLETDMMSVFFSGREGPEEEGENDAEDEIADAEIENENKNFKESEDLT